MFGIKRLQNFTFTTKTSLENLLIAYREGFQIKFNTPRTLIHNLWTKLIFIIFKMQLRHDYEMCMLNNKYIENKQL